MMTHSLHYQQSPPVQSGEDLVYKILSLPCSLYYFAMEVFIYIYVIQLQMSFDEAFFVHIPLLSYACSYFCIVESCLTLVSIFIT